MRFDLPTYLLFLLCLLGCSGEDPGADNALFQRLPFSVTHVSFFNKIEEDDSFNILNYEYLYNGGGVGILDVNNDGLSDLFFTGNQVSNTLYLNQGNLEFEDISQAAGIELKNEWCTGVSIIDINADGYDDIYVCVGGMGNQSIFPNKLFINQKDMTFKEAAETYGLADPGESIQAAFFDYDKDGDLDMYLLTGGGFEKSAIVARAILENGENRNTDRLYKNTYDSILGHPVFQDVSAAAGILIEGFGLGVSIIDANQDTWPDVYVSNDYISRDLLYINNRDGTFTDRSLEFFKHTSHFSMGNDMGDINNDGLPDIVTLDMLPEDHTRRKLMFGPNQYDRFYMAVQRNYGYQYMRNMLHLNHGKDGFSEIGQLAGIHRTDWSWAPLLADFDNDGYQDIYITNGFGKDVTDLDFVKFRENAAAPFADKEKMEKLFLDSLKQRPSITLPNYMYRNEKDLTFSDQSAHWGITQPSISNGAAYADLDGDGDLEIIVSNMDQEAFIYKNNTVEWDSMAANFLKVRLAGPVSNPAGLGAQVSVFTQGAFQCRYHQVVRGFQSSVEKVIHFGLGPHKMVDSLIVTWPDGKQSSRGHLEANHMTVVNYKNAVASSPKSSAHKPYFSPVKVINYTHQETEFNDFSTQPLLMHGFSRQGPGMAVGDVNGDGWDDVFVGGAYQSSGALFLQSAKGDFEKRSIPTEDFEDLGVVFFDADGDGDLDLYVASGGVERYARYSGYQDRLYFNDGKGNFALAASALPSMLTSTSVVAAADYDQDGDLDLFVGGRVQPGEYPKTPASYLLENRSGQFVDVTDQINPALRNIGMVTSAIWTDFNNDFRPDLVLAGESMRITLLKNERKQLVDITYQTALADTYGMWNSLLAGDFDNDGDMDMVAGNLGLNTPFEVSPEKPLEVHFADFDQNGSVDPIFASYEEGNSYPLASLDQLTAQLPSLKKHILHYRDYAKTTTAGLLQLTDNDAYETLYCKMLASSFIENLGDDQFAITPLSLQAQWAPVNGMAAEDINLDGLLDLVLVGNSYSPEVVNGRYDASIGTVLLNRGKNTFQPLNPTGFCVKGDAKGMARLELAGNQSLLIVAQNNDEVMSFIIKKYNGLKRIKPTENETSALLTLSDGKQRKTAFPVGSSYLSQHSRSIVITPQVKAVQLFDIKGQTTRQIDF